MFAQEHRDLREWIQETKSSLKFHKKLFEADSIDHFLLFLYKESCRQFKIRSLIFYYYSGHFGPTRYVCNSKEVSKSFCPPCALSPPSKGQIRVKAKEDSQYLADSLGRPVQNILSIPVHNQQYGEGAFLFVELASSKLDRARNFYKSHLELITKSLDQLLLQDHLETGIELWTSTFNGLEEPLAIFDEQSEVSSANNFFNKIFSDKNPSVREQKNFQWKERIFKKYSYPVRIKDNKYTIAHYADISESLNLRSKLIQNTKMSALGELGEAVAHELSNPLTGVFSMSQLLLESGKLNPEMQADIQDIAKSVSRSQEIITNLLEFSRTNPKLSICDLNEMVQKTLPFLKSIITSSEFNLDLAPQLVSVRVQPGLLQQVIFNLIKNACQAVSGQEVAHQVKVSVYKKDKEGEGAFLCVEDSGRGVHPRDYENIFKAFFTTKSRTKGTGLGLNISRSIVHSFKGNLKISRSALGGACFTMSLPLG